MICDICENCGLWEQEQECCVCPEVTRLLTEQPLIMAERKILKEYFQNALKRLEEMEKMGEKTGPDSEETNNQQAATGDQTANQPGSAAQPCSLCETTREAECAECGKTIREWICDDCESAQPAGGTQAEPEEISEEWLCEQEQRARKDSARGVMWAWVVVNITTALRRAREERDRLHGEWGNAADIATKNLEQILALRTRLAEVESERDQLHERIRNQAEHIRADPVAVLSCVNKIVTEQLECGHDLTEWCDNCETCGQCRDEQEREPIAREVEQLRAEVGRLRELLGLFVRKGKYHMEQWPDDKEMRAGLDKARAALAEGGGENNQK